MSTINRISGLASGLDTETMVKDLMKAERKPLDSLLRKKQMDSWQRDDYRELNLMIASFRDNTMRDMKLQSTYLKKTISSSNDSIVTAKQKGNPSLDAYVIKDVQLAVAGTPHATNFSTTVSDPNTALGNTFDLKIKGHTGVEKTIEVTATDSMNSIISKINSVSSDTGVVASFNAVDKKMVFTANKNGATDMSIAVVSPGTSTPATTNFGLADYSATAVGQDDVKGSVTINGTTLQISSNTFTYDGMEFTFKQNSIPGQTYTISASPDEDAIFNSISKFVEDYNTLIDKLNSKISEARYKDYQPLSDEEKAAMDEKVIEKWEEKAKSGLLRRDPMITDALTQMRNAIFNPVSGVDKKFDLLTEIGISTTRPGGEGSASNYLDKGKLFIDEKKLREAIRANGNDVMDIFTKSSSSTDSQTKYAESGIAQRLYDTLGSITSTITKKAGSLGMTDESEYYTMGKSMKSLNEQISKWKDRLEDIENRYWSKFSALENAMNRMNSQSAWLSQQLGG
ncbi:flagellar filament capping protein FliD [Brevibacillus centrosporus]|uniref:Flagellar hook-associated protein 2 n=1 Tax=Brevibacillus centrosporus TaxID=54910 RepID=A0A1I4CF93_9BACL|nr:flagellar filament capping protein FliD [Brevibacillus centrosporus]SFK79902.1 flagellar hook-associated protein 2 [Brevibacillus centrosporus]